MQCHFRPLLAILRHQGAPRHGNEQGDVTRLQDVTNGDGFWHLASGTFGTCHFVCQNRPKVPRGRLSRDAVCDPLRQGMPVTRIREMAWFGVVWRGFLAHAPRQMWANVPECPQMSPPARGQGTLASGLRAMAHCGSFWDIRDISRKARNVAYEGIPTGMEGRKRHAPRRSCPLRTPCPARRAI